MNKTIPSRKKARVVLGAALLATATLMPFLPSKKTEASPSSQDSTKIQRAELFQDNDDLYSNDAITVEDLTMITQMAHDQSKGFQPH